MVRAGIGDNYGSLPTNESEMRPDAMKERAW